MQTFNKFFIVIYLVLFSLVFVMSGCSENEEPTQPNGGNTDGASRIIWTFNGTGGELYTSKPWIETGKLFICSDDSTLFCLNPDNGSQIWKTVGHGIIETSPVVYGDKVIVGGINVSAFKVTDGSPVWHFKDSVLSPTIYTSPALNSDKIYLGNILFYYCLNAEDGLQVWKNQSTHGQNMSGAFPKIAGDKCYFGNSAGNLYGLNLSTGSEDLVINIGSAINITPEVDITNNRIYVGTQSANNSFRCYDLNGTELWKTNIGIVMSSPTLADNKIYVMGGSTFHCLSASDGSVQWTRTCRAGSVSKPVVLDGKVYFGDGDELLCLNASDGKLLWQYIAPGSPGFGSPTIVGNRLYVGTADSKVHCFKID